MGKTKIFIKNPANVFRLEEERDDKLEAIATIIQRWFRKLKARRIMPDLGRDLLEGKVDGFNAKRMLLHGVYVHDRAGLVDFQEAVGFTSFAADVTKISTKGKPMPRVLLLSASAVYKVDRKYAVKPKRVLEFSQIAALCISPKPDTFVVLKGASGAKDTLVDLGGLGKVGEFACRLTVASKAAGRAIPVRVEDLTWNGKAVTVEKGAAPFSFAKPATVYHQ